MRNVVFAFVVTSVLVSATAASAETWRCHYSGRWSTTGSRNAGAFKWAVTWTGTTARGWRVVGDYRDRYGMSYLDGHCRNKTCSMKQTYKTGKLTGKTYTWVGTYVDQNDGPDSGINTFTGTWRADDGSTRGPWSATAVCKRK